MKRLLFLLALSALPMHALGTASITEIVDERTPLLKAPTCSFCVGIEEKTNGRIRAMDLHAHVCGNQKLAGQLLVKGFWGALWAANVYLLYRLVNELRLSNDFRTTATTRGLSDLISTDLSKVGSSRAIKVIAGTLATATAAYVLYQEIVGLLAQEERQETSA